MNFIWIFVILGFIILSYFILGGRIGGIMMGLIIFNFIIFFSMLGGFDCNNQLQTTNVTSHNLFDNLFCKETRWKTVDSTQLTIEEIDMLYNDGVGIIDNDITIYDDVTVVNYNVTQNDDYRYETLSTNILNDNTLLNLGDI